MTPNPFNLEMAGIRSRTREMLLVSGGLHLLLVLMFSMAHEIAPPPPTLTEITWMDPEEVQAAPPPPEEVKPKVEKSPLVAKAPEPQHFERQEEKAEEAPEPQSDQVSRDRLAERLNALQQQTNRSPAPALAVAHTSPNVSLAAPTGTAPSAARVDLNREASPTRQPIALRRQAPTAKPVAAVAPKNPAPTRSAPRAASTSSRNLAGATLTGEVADRRLLSYSTPKYPDWAKREAVEGSVRLYFVVLRGGEIKKENVMVQKTSGYEDFDKNATKALMTWRFESLPPGQNGEQWGEITFNYRLSDGAGH